MCSESKSKKQVKKSQYSCCILVMVSGFVGFTMMQKKLQFAR